jgi:hypothetical protein
MWRTVRERREIDDAKSPLTAMFRSQGFVVRDETYTMGAKSFSRGNVHVLASIDYAGMSAADRTLEDYPRADHDYALSWIKREAGAACSTRPTATANPSTR